MSDGLLIGCGSAVWLGILTAINPCPLATNIAAMSFIARRVDNPRAAVATGLLYAIGRSAVYVALAAMLVASVLAAPEVSQWLQKYMNKLLGPLLILVGMVLLNLLTLPVGNSGMAERIGKRVAGWGIWAGFALGVVFALSFCPASAALFFASLVPLAIKYESVLVLPLLYGSSTALPVLIFALLIAVGTQAVGRAFDRVAAFERWARTITGVVFVLVGVYFSLRFVFGVL